ncbi:hypothetical protein AB0D99_24685 [Streptomyces sp. NPDC047971]|uniref:hypothetical protein n=1 Tax=Streptomyces sp. NPDC047971 TaxID=3154499 RepID=UPI0033CBF402
MRRHRAPRRLVVDDTVWVWTVGHRHPPCRELLTLRRADTPHDHLRLVFQEGPGRVTQGGTMGRGQIADTGDGYLNLNKPGVVRRFVEEATARGLLPTVPGGREIDGWPLFDALVTRENGTDQGDSRRSGAGPA